MERPRTQARTRWLPIWSVPVLSGSTRTTVPSFTCRRNGQRDPQFTVHADHTVRSASAMPSVAACAVEPWGIPRLVTVLASAAVPPTAADHLRKVRRVGDG
ncbi:Hypothetical protein PFR_JS4_2005 [Propionibacterium freudenreichii]|nr:Hypothetical protein PFR_JS4_2005 [Propionibacterium freudenreichii]